jgi:hypothetical protein
MRKPFRTADRRLVGAAVVSGLLLVPLGVFGSSALARTAGPSAAQYQYKVTICHHTGSKKHPWHLITISNRAVPAHLRHHDQMPPCPTVLGTTGHHHGHGHDSGDHHGKPPTTGAVTTVQGSSSSQGDDQDDDGGGHGHGNGHDNGHHGKS